MSEILDLQATIARLEELDKARTQGEWTVNGFFYWKIDVDGSTFAEISHDDGPNVLTDSKFIAAAPTMMQVIREQQACIDKMVEALEASKVYLLRSFPNADWPAFKVTAQNAVNEALAVVRERKVGV